MSKYIDKDKVLEYIIFGVVGKDITCGELKRAIESLPAIEVSEDCISRQDALEALDRIGSLDTEADREYARDIFDNLPPVTPTVSEDCISREWLINHFEDIVEHYEMRIKRVERYGEKTTYDTSEQIGYWKDEIADYKYFIRELENAPSVVPKAKEGEWILECDAEGEGDNLYRCSTCGQRCGCQEYDLPNYCGNCGAKMKG